MAITIESKPFSNGISKSAEETKAEELVKQFKEDLDQYPEAKGKIKIFSSVNIIGEKRRNIDILVIGYFEDFIINGNFISKSKERVQNIKVKSLIANIELKSHPKDKVTRKAGSYYVKYSSAEYLDATAQCLDAKFSLIQLLQSQLNIRCFITDLLWFDSLNKYQLNGLRGDEHDNALASGFTFSEALQAMIYKADLKYEDGVYCFDAIPNAKINKDLISNFLAQNLIQ